MPEQSTNQHDELTSHNYDGIQEYDNPIPGWWHMIFLGSIVFAFLYVFVFQMTSLVPNRIESYDHKVAVAEEAQFGELRQMPMDEIKLRTIVGNPKWLETGKSIFKGTCVVCHGPDGQGIQGLGLNLTDENYLFVKDMMGFVEIIKNGTPSKKMPPQNQLNTNEIAMVAAYVSTLRGENLPGPPGTDRGETIPAFPDPIVDKSGG